MKLKTGTLSKDELVETDGTTRCYKKLYRNIKQEDALNLNQDELSEMIELFKADISSKNLTESSCLYKIQKEDPKRFDEIKSDFEYVDKKGVKAKNQKAGIKWSFSLAFGIKNFLTIENLFHY